MIGFWNRPLASMERARARFGKRFTIRLPATPPFVIHSEPDHIKEIFAAPPEVLHPGEGARLLEPIVGAHSLILLDEGPHLSQRKLLLPALHGERLAGLSGLVRDVTEREVESWPTGEPVVTHDHLQDLTLEIILRAVFGLDPGPRLDELRTLLRGILEFSVTPVSMIPALQRSYFGGGPFVRFAKLRERADELIAEVVEERRADPGDRDDVLTMLLEARHDDGSPMSYDELRDELMTLLTAGHETTASELTWAFAILAREPRVQAELAAEVDAGAGEEYLTATRPRDPPPPPGPAERRAAPRQAGGRDRRLDLPAGRLADRQRLPPAPRPRDLPRPLRLPPRALRRREAGHLHVDPVRRRASPLHRRRVRHARDARGSARGLRALPARAGRGGAGGHAPPRDHGQPEARRPHDLPRPARPSRIRTRAVGGPGSRRGVGWFGSRPEPGPARRRRSGRGA